MDINTSYWELYNTVIHECRHKFQDMAIINPEKYPEINSKAAQYLSFSDKTYPRDENSIDYEEEYWKNGLEKDAFAYANGRMAVYEKKTKTPFDILSISMTETNIIKNQILMNPGDINKIGRRAPITVSETYNSEEFLQYQQDIKGENGNMEQGTGGTNFSEEAQGAAANVYGKVIEDIQNFSEKMIGDITERIKTHPYKQLEKVVNTFIDYYNEKLPSEIKTAIHEWIQSENSFSSSLKKHDEEESTASVNAAEKLQDGLLDKVDECFGRIDQVKIELAVNVDKGKIINDAQYIESYFKVLQNLRDEWAEKMQKYSEQNSLFINMASLVIDTFKHVEKVYQAAQKDIVNVGDEFAQAWSNVIDYGTNFSTERTKVERNISDLFTMSRKRH